MSVVLGETGVEAELPLRKGSDYKYQLDFVTDDTRQPVPYPDGAELFYEIETGTESLRWDFQISGSTATIRIESEVTDPVPYGCAFRLMFVQNDVTPPLDTQLAYGTVRRY